jgi:hypothetical protein
MGVTAPAVEGPEVTIVANLLEYRRAGLQVDLLLPDPW